MADDAPVLVGRTRGGLLCILEEGGIRVDLCETMGIGGGLLWRGEVYGLRWE